MDKSINPKLILTADGSHTLLREDLNETYHSTKGALAESKYVFIEQGLNFYLSKKPAMELDILEVGLGTGLNCWLTIVHPGLLETEVRYTALEPFPIGKETVLALNYVEGSDPYFFQIHSEKGDLEIRDGFALRKSFCKLEDYQPDKHFDIIYFDAFAPSRQPEVWQYSNLEKCFHSLKQGGVLVTYCASGQFKRDLKQIGFEVETLPGALGKKEMVRAQKPG